MMRTPRPVFTGRQLALGEEIEGAMSASTIAQRQNDGR